MILDAAAEDHFEVGSSARSRASGAAAASCASFLDRIRAAYATDPDLVSLLAEAGFAQEISDAQVPWREIVASAARRGIPVPAFSAALAHYDTLRADRLPAALLQGRRGLLRRARAYRRTDREGSFHTSWSQPDRPETTA